MRVRGKTARSIAGDFFGGHEFPARCSDARRGAENDDVSVRCDAAGCAVAELPSTHPECCSGEPGERGKPLRETRG